MNPQSLAYVEDLYARYARDPASVPAAWRQHFDALAQGDPFVHERHAGPAFRRSGPPGKRRAGEHARLPNGLSSDVPSGRSSEARSDVPSEASSDSRREPSSDLLRERVARLVDAYRERGHEIAHIDPLGSAPSDDAFEPSRFGLGPADMERRVALDGRDGPPPRVRDVVERMRETYAGPIGVEVAHIGDEQARAWLHERMESSAARPALSPDAQLRVLSKLTDAAVLEEFMRKRWVGAKSFSLEGSESLIPLLDLVVEHAGEQGIDEIVMGMAHRGRLDVLVNILQKSPRRVFQEFEDDRPEAFGGRGDVKYHLGHGADVVTRSGRTVHVSLCFNPSHLEYVDPIVLGRLRAKQDRSGDVERTRGMALMLHGDAAFAGGGVVQETLNLSGLAAYTTGGALHVVVDNAIGFTTPPEEGRAGRYATDVAKMLAIPILHVNAEDPEAVAHAVALCMAFRARFARDVVIDLHGYRRFGHNEGDEPAFTQPLLYARIRERPSVRALYAERLASAGSVTAERADELRRRSKQALDEAFEAARDQVPSWDDPGPSACWADYRGGPEDGVPEVDTALPIDRLREILEGLVRLPHDFHLHEKLERGFARRRAMTGGEVPLDWSAGEALAFGSLALQGHRVRLAGQDTARGTFSQRHAVLHDVEDGRTYCPLQHLSPDQAPVEIVNSPLCEAAALGFEYGYSLDVPDALVAWEAQFGDFINAAQVIVDQFLASAEDKWRRLSGLVLLLPHGFEGQGPEHSSARLERFLLLAAEDNIQVAQPTTPAQLFHLLRRQVLRPWRKPLVVLTPKGLLRSRHAVSTLDDLSHGGFRRVLPDADGPDPAGVARVVLSSGKLHYELAAHRAEHGRDDVALLRLEQLYPLKREVLDEALAPYPRGVPVVWAQDEPENMGAWRYVRGRFGDSLSAARPLWLVCRPESASPATGSHAAHRVEQQQLVADAFDGGCAPRRDPIQERP